MSYDVILNRFAIAKENTMASGTKQESPSDGLTIAGSSSGAEHSRTSSNTSTPSRKISTSRFAIPFTTNFLVKEKESCTTSAPETSTVSLVHAKIQNSDEIKGKVESKLLSMWQNVKYGMIFYLFIII